MSCTAGLAAIGCAAPAPTPTAEPQPTSAPTARPASRPARSSESGVLTIGLPVPMGFFTTDPHARVDEIGRLIASFYSDTLVRWENGKFVPALATSWRAVDELTWELTLREGVQFSNGAPFDAETVVYNVQRILAGIGGEHDAIAEALWNEAARARMREILAPLADRLGTLQSATAVDASTVRITTTAPDPIFVGRLLELRIVPTEFDRQRLRFQRRTPGTGPFQIQEADANEGMVLAASPSSWRGAPKLEGVRIRYFPEVTDRLASLRAGELHLISGVPRTQMDSLKRAGFQVKSVPTPGTLAIFISPKSGTPLADRAFRHALNLAIDKEAIVKNVFRGEATVAKGQVVTDFTVGFNPQLAPYPFDPGNARSIIQSLGIDRLDEPLRYQIGAPGHEELAEAVVGYWRNAGLSVMTQGVEPRRSFIQPNTEDRTLGALQIVTVDPGPALDAELALQPWISERVEGRWRNPQFEQLIAGARQTMDTAQRSELLRDALAVMREEAPAVFLVQPNEIWAAAKNVTGFELSMGPQLPAELLGKS